MPDESDKSVPAARLPPQTAERWRQIVERAAVNGTDISQLVQHFAERAFENKTVGLDSQGSRRRSLTQMRVVVGREIARATAWRKKIVESKKQQMTAPFEGVSITFVPPARINLQERKKTHTHVTPMALEGGTQASKSSPLAQKITTLAELDHYIEQLTGQAAQVDQEMVQIDEVLNRGMSNRESTVRELSATTQELWRIAQEVIAALPAPAPVAKTEDTPKAPVPQPMSDEPTQGLPMVEPAERPHAGAQLLRGVQAFFKRKR